MVSVHVSLNLKGSLKIFNQETMGASENRFAPELNEKEVIELLGNATPGTTHSLLSTPMTNFYAKQILRNLHPHRQTMSSDTIKISCIPQPWPRVGRGVGVSIIIIFKCISV